MLKIAVNEPVHPPSLQRLREMDDVQVELFEPSPPGRPFTLPRDRVGDAEILFSTFPPDNLDDLAGLRLLQIASAGYSHLQQRGLAERSIRVANGSGIFDVPIAEWCLCMMVALARDLRGLIRNQDAGIFDRSERFQAEIRGRVLGIWGYGGIGRETARQAKALGLVVHALTRGGAGPRRNAYAVPGTGDPDGVLPDRVFRTEEKMSFLSGLDFLVLAMPLTPENEGLIGEEELRALPRHAFVLNPARGPLIREQALLRALREPWIAGAALDTHYHYPLPADHPLWRFPNVILTPHISGSTGTPAFRPRVWELFLANVARWRGKEPLLNEIPAARLRA